MSPPQPPRPRGMPLAGSARGPGHFAAACTGCPRSRCASADAQAGFDEAQRVLSDDLTGAERGKRACGAMIKRDEELLALQGLLLFNAEGRLLINDRTHSDTQRNQMDADLSAAHHEREKSAWRASASTGASWWWSRAPRARPAKLGHAQRAERRGVELNGNLHEDKQIPIWITRKYIKDLIFKQSGVFATFRRSPCTTWGPYVREAAARARGAWLELRAFPQTLRSSEPCTLTRARSCVTAASPAWPTARAPRTCSPCATPPTARQRTSGEEAPRGWLRGHRGGAAGE